MSEQETWNDFMIGEAAQLLQEIQSGYAVNQGSYDAKAQPLTYKDLAAMLSDKIGEDVNPERLRSALRRRGMNITSLGTAKKAIFEKPIDRLFENGMLVIADLHVPYQNNRLIEIATDIATRYFEVDTVTVAGDLFNFDTISRYGIEGFEVSLEEEFSEATRVLKYLKDNFHYMYLTNGNHDERLRARLQQFVRYQRLIDMLVGPEAGIVATDYDYLIAQFGQWNKWVIGHLSSYNKRPGEVARKLCDKFQANAAVGHDHIQGFTSTNDNKFLAISIGAMVALDERGNSPFWYKQKRLNHYDNIRNGFLIIDKYGTPHLFNEWGSVCLNGVRPFSFYMD